MLVVREPAGGRHGLITVNLTLAIGTFVRSLISVTSSRRKPGSASPRTLVWLVDPSRRLARVYRADGSESLLADTDSLDGEGVLPGFSCRLAEFL